ELEEAVLTVQGYLIKKELPPVLTMPRATNAAKHMRQSVRLAGVGMDRFDKVLTTVHHAHSQLACNYALGPMIP
ncbi:hypothetical protein L210DRAFT_836919, partial [Boletus edulis BED1]